MNSQRILSFSTRIGLRNASTYGHGAGPSKITITHLQKLHKSKTPITVLTCADYPTALMLSPHVDIILVGDSLGMVHLGLPATKHLTLQQMVHHCAAVSRGATRPFLIGDLPFGYAEHSVEKGVEAAVAIIKDGGMDAVKIEGGVEVVPLINRLTSFGVPVIGHIGLNPQRETSLGGFKVQGKTSRRAKLLWEDAKLVKEAGAFGMVIEAVPPQISEWITSNLGNTFTIGIGAGNGTSGQVLVATDAFGFYGEEAHRPRFAKQFVSVKDTIESGVKQYVNDVKSRKFPEDGTHTYKMTEGEWEKFEEEMKNISN